MAQKWVDLAKLGVFIIGCLIKVSFCLFLMRIPNSRRVIYFLWALIATLVLVNASCTIVFVLQCRPFNALWNPMINGHCWNPNINVVLGYLQGGNVSRV